MTTHAPDHNSIHTTRPRVSLIKDTILPRAFLFVMAAICIMSMIAPKPAMQIGGGLLAIIAIAGIFIDRTIVRAVPRLALIICGGMILAIAASALWSIAPHAALKACVKLPLIFIAGLCIIAYARVFPAQAVRFFYYGPHLFLAVMLIVLWSQLFNFPLQRWWSEAPASQILDSVLNKGMGAISLLVPALLMPAFYQGGRPQKMLVGLGLVTLYLVILGSQAQSSLLVFILMLVGFFMPLGSKWLWRAMRLGIVVGILCAPIVVHHLHTDIAATLNQSALMKKASGAERLELWDAVARKALERPILGHGYDATRYVEKFDTRALYYPYTTFMHPHNMALQFWIEFGVVGVFLGIAALIAVSRRIQYDPNPLARRLHFLTFTSTLAVSMIAWGMWETWWVILMFVLVAANALASKALPNANP